MTNAGPSSLPRWAVPAALAAIALLGLGAYANTFGNPFVFLDVPAIADNASIRHLWPLSAVLNPPSAGGVTVGGRPMVNLSLALNYAAGGLNVRGYHVVNLAIHVLAAWTLFGLLRRSAERLAAPRSACAWALAAAALWVAHPLTTESVTYIVQRAESLMALFYLLTLYAFCRATERLCVGGGNGPERAAGRTPSLAQRSISGARLDALSPPGTPDGRDESGDSEQHSSVSDANMEARRSLWTLGAISACLLGMATKEVMVSAPVIVFLYDAVLLSGSCREAWRRNWGRHLALAATWIPLAVLVAAGGGRGGTAGIGLGFSWARYVSTQAAAIVRYLRLAVWPAGLNFNYTYKWDPARVVVVDGLLVLVLAAATLWALFRAAPERRRVRAAGLAGLWFFAILAPTSLVPGGTQTLAEHRMYLALVPVILCVLLAVAAWRPRAWLAAAGCGLAAAALTAATVRRNLDYRSALALWSDTVAKSPDNPYAQNNLGIALAQEGKQADAARCFAAAVKLNPSYAEAQNNLGLADADLGQIGDAILAAQSAVRLRPHYPEAYANLGVALARAGRVAEGVAQLRTALEQDPNYDAARGDLALLLAGTGHVDEALGQYRQLIRRQPENAEARYNYGTILVHLNRFADAAEQFQAVVKARPNFADGYSNLGVALAETGDEAGAERAYRGALRVNPNDADVHYNLALALKAQSRASEAADEFAAAARLRGR